MSIATIEARAHELMSMQKIELARALALFEGVTRHSTTDIQGAYAVYGGDIFLDYLDLNQMLRDYKEPEAFDPDVIEGADATPVDNAAVEGADAAPADEPKAPAKKAAAKKAKVSK